MTIHRRAAKRDKNEGEIVDALRYAGLGVDQISGSGTPDLVVGGAMSILCPHCNSWFSHEQHQLIEIKMPGEKLTDTQEKWHSAWPLKIPIAHSIEEALAAVGR